MGKIENSTKKLTGSFAVKVAAFLVMLLCATVIVASAIIIIVNAENQWYSKSKEAVEQELYEAAASFANQELSEQLFAQRQDEAVSEEENSEPLESGDIGGSAGESGGANTEESDGLAIRKDVQLIDGEGAASDFGYQIQAKTAEFRFEAEDGVDTVRTVNRDIVENNAGIYQKTFIHDFADITVYLGVIAKESVPGAIYDVYHAHSLLYQWGKLAIATGALGLILFVCLLLFLLTSVGKKEGANGWLRKVPVELLLMIAVVLAAFLCAVNQGLLWNANLDILVVFVIADTVLATAIIAGFLLMAVIKGRQHTLWHGSLCDICYRVLKWMGRHILCLVQCVPLVWKSAAVVFAGILLNLFIMVQLLDYYASGAIMLMWFIGAALTEGLAIYIALGMRKLREGAKRLAEGDLGHQIDKKGLFFDFASHADDLNSIGAGMSKAVEERMKSERFKTELITNVSHDIKTPLTSIINYVDFLKKEEIENEKAREYIDVLDRQSQRLKKLTEDLLEASKAATGSVKLDIRPCQAGVLMVQVMGEYEERTKAENLTLVSKIPDEKLEIMADGRSMQRIFDNIFSNICKYSQPGTRVYQSLEKIDGKAVITYKNTSKYELNITEEELMERFVRGDSSRHTEGSGLGLSIAKNLAQLQGGSFRIYIDGDLFKVVMEFPLSGN